MHALTILLIIGMLLGCANERTINSYSSTKCLNYCNENCNYQADQKYTNSNISGNINNNIDRILNKNEILSAGDVLNINILNNVTLSKDYIIKSNGNIYLPWIAPIQAEGLSIDELNEKILTSYIANDIFKKDSFYPIITVIKYAPISIKVNGEVFKPGFIIINKNDPILNHYKDLGISHTEDKMLTLAIKLAGGIKPTADITNVRLVRGGVSYIIDLNGVLSDGGFKDIPLANGDEIYIGSSLCVDTDLIRVSKITPIGIKLFLSNTTIPAENNNLSNINRDTREMPYGSRLMDAVFSANCMGGTESTNSGRGVLLITSLNNDDNLVALKIGTYDLVKHRNNPHYNPYLMNGDKIACYDSGMTNYLAIVKSLTETLLPITLLHGLIGW
ncbi:polysaccharide biosynthesis/export family protein [Photobacterium piscicola]|uniref:polysaccharide biosynthesis/export family protein n=1 Tax=Photobacterium piscicola TaxID=1378299 RepID=UPI002E19EB46|nr:polysaccharide biosynthesis/export family protein [Photobacterium piscicola]